MSHNKSTTMLPLKLRLILWVACTLGFNNQLLARGDGAIRFIHSDDTSSAVATASYVYGDAAYYWTSGSIAAPHNSELEWGDPDLFSASLYEQSTSTLFSLSQNLARVGLTPQDLAFMRVYIVVNEDGKLDTDPFWKAYKLFFGTPENNIRPPVSIVSLPALALPGLMVEIEWVASFPLGTSLETERNVDPAATHPRIATIATASSAIAEGKALLPQTSLYFASGNIPHPVNPNDPISAWQIEGTVYRQSVGALERIQSGLRSRGLSFADVVFLRCFLVEDTSQPYGDESPFADWNRAYSEFFNTSHNPNRPARTTVLVPPFDLAGMKVEIEVVAAFPDAAGPFPNNKDDSPNSNVISYGSPGFPIAEGKSVARRTPLIWSGTLEPDTESSDLTDQAIDVLSKAETILATEGLELSDIVFLRVYGIPDASTGNIDRPAWNKAYDQYFGNDTQPIKPARTFLPVPALQNPSAKIAIDFIAADHH